MIDPITGWFEIVPYDDKRAINIVNLVETTWLYRYPRPIEITYDQVKESIGHELRKYLIETEYRITAKPSTLENTIFNAILEQINQVIGNLVRTFKIQQTYIEKNELWTGILGEAAFVIRSTTSRQKGYILGQLIFGRDMILLKKHRVDWELICKKIRYKSIDIVTVRINIELTMIIPSDIKLSSLTKMHKNMKLHIKARL